MKARPARRLASPFRLLPLMATHWLIVRKLARAVFLAQIAERLAVRNFYLCFLIV